MVKQFRYYIQHRILNYLLAMSLISNCSIYLLMYSSDPAAISAPFYAVVPSIMYLAVVILGFPLLRMKEIERFRSLQNLISCFLIWLFMVVFSVLVDLMLGYLGNNKISISYAEVLGKTSDQDPELILAFARMSFFVQNGTLNILMIGVGVILASWLKNKNTIHLQPSSPL